MLDCGAIERRAYFSEQGIARIAFNTVQPQFDQFMSVEATVDLGQNRRCKAFLADGHDRIQMVRGGTQAAALGGSKFSHGGIVA